MCYSVLFQYQYPRIGYIQHRKGNLVYMAFQVHGTLHNTLASRVKCDGMMADRIRHLREVGYRSVLVMPNRVDMICSDHRSEWPHYGIPCASVSVQTDRGEIPHVWIEHYMNYCARCKHHMLRLQCLCDCHDYDK